jgi:hypothetical protein
MRKKQLSLETEHPHSCFGTGGPIGSPGSSNLYLIVYHRFLTLAGLMLAVVMLGERSEGCSNGGGGYSRANNCRRSWEAN